MAYDKEKIYIQAEEAITKNNLFFIEDIVAFLPCDKSTFYRFFDIESNEYHTLKGLLEQNKIKTKSSIRAKLYKGTKSSELLALYRMICSDEERKTLNQQYIESRNLNVSEPPLFPDTTEDKD
jgi:hypothetical protein